VSNIVRGMQQFMSPASSLALLKAKSTGENVGLKTLSSEAIGRTMLFGIWLNEFEAEDAALKAGLRRT
jgi:hypothetical protein